MRHVLVLVAACVIGAPATATAQDRDREAPDLHRRPDRIVAGTLTTEVTPCASLCTESEWAGSLDGVSEFSLISIENEDIPGENISRFHGHLALSTARGDLVGTDLGTWNLDSGHYVDVYTITSGTDEYTGVSGIVLLFGTLDPVAGSGFSHYRGVLSFR